MRKYIKLSFLIFSFTILMSHSFVPHQHMDDDASLQFRSMHDHGDCFFNILSSMFGQNLGEDHLENFKSKKTENFQFLAPELAREFMEIRLISLKSLQEENLFIPATVGLPQSEYYDVHTLRGPPAA
ncbi:hypothetical protein QQ008_26565 [Fulvivirgaceae bacterium BMA10]|uniref:Uncharacterized protein n=1 Tax=Splendidivirga corallicola TaxID=3051826 RepID=A0ABT8KW22_9BACT|nr:hypothetical protein [Fulvivirgaceae bacterium BMA10]